MPEWVNSLQVWAKGLVAAMIGGVATSSITILADPASFNFGEGFGRLKTVAIASAIVSAANYLKRSPLPGVTIAALFFALAMSINGCGNTTPPVAESVWDLGANAAGGIVCSQLPDSAKGGARAAVHVADVMTPDALYEDLASANSAIKLLSPSLYDALWQGIHWVLDRMSITGSTKEQQALEWVKAATRVAWQALSGCAKVLAP